MSSFLFLLYSYCSLNISTPFTESLTFSGTILAPTEVAVSKENMFFSFELISKKVPYRNIVIFFLIYYTYNYCGIVVYIKPIVQSQRHPIRTLSLILLYVNRQSYAIYFSSRCIIFTYVNIKIIIFIKIIYVRSCLHCSKKPHKINITIFIICGTIHEAANNIPYHQHTI